MVQLILGTRLEIKACVLHSLVYMLCSPVVKFEHAVMTALRGESLVRPNQKQIEAVARAGKRKRQNKTGKNRK